jgi:hypothetical protein
VKIRPRKITRCRRPQPLATAIPVRQCAFARFNKAARLPQKPRGSGTQEIPPARLGYRSPKMKQQIATSGKTVCCRALAKTNA